MFLQCRIRIRRNRFDGRYFGFEMGIIVSISTMVFYIIGLGLGDPQDISVKALKVIQSCKEVYLEYYTSVMSTSNAEL